MNTSVFQYFLKLAASKPIAASPEKNETIRVPNKIIVFKLLIGIDVKELNSLSHCDEIAKNVAARFHITNTSDSSIIKALKTINIGVSTFVVIRQQPILILVFE